MRSLRTSLLLAMLALVSAILLATMLSTQGVLEHAARQELSAGLDRSRTDFASLLAFRGRLFSSQAQVIAEEPRLKAVLTTEGVSSETILGVAQAMRKLVGSELFVLTNRRGDVIVDVTSPESERESLAENPVVAAALAKGRGEGIWILGHQAFQVVGQRMAFGEAVFGVAVLGYAVGDSLAEDLSLQTGSEAAMVLGERVIGASGFAARMGRGELDREMARLPVNAGPQKVTLGGEKFIALASDYPGYQGSIPMHLVVLRSLDSALAPAQRLVRVLYLITSAALLAALVLAAWIAQRVAGPVRELVLASSKVGQGDLAVRAKPQGPRELADLAVAFNQMADGLKEGRRSAQERLRLERDMEIAARIQTSILPRNVHVVGASIGAKMEPALEVGGDYYDVFPTEDGCFVAVGDVAGHGLTAGLVMLMVQSTMAALVGKMPQASPSEIICALNRVLYENIRGRMRQDEHVTFTLFRIHRNGQVHFAGAHEEILVFRASEQRHEVVPTQGTWLGVRPDISGVTADSHLTLRPGDVLLLYTDGVVEAANSNQEQFGLERLIQEFTHSASLPPDKICEAVVQAVHGFCPVPQDDVTVLALRYDA